MIKIIITATNVARIIKGIKVFFQLFCLDLNVFAISVDIVIGRTAQRAPA